MKNLLLLFILLNSITFAELVKAKVTYVIDGDTFHATINNKKEKIRMFGIDAPETKQEWGKESKKALKKLINEKEILLDIKAKYKCGELLSMVYLDGVNINLQMIKNGNAWWYPYSDKNNKENEEAMLTAKAKKLGLWSKKNPIEPYEFRKGK